MNIADLRKEYLNESLDIKDVDSDPFKQFKKWFSEAQKSQIREPNAMTLSTVSQDNHPSSRIVLLKGVGHDGFLFFTNYQSDKGEHIKNNPAVSLNFFWDVLERQIRIDGFAKKVETEISDDYFNSRPIGSRIGALASPQSQVVESRAWLENRFEVLTVKSEKESIQRPEHWGGYRVTPTRIEFWQGRASRLHDRIVYHQSEEGWRIQRLAP